MLDPSTGLTTDEACRRLERNGANAIVELPMTRRRGLARWCDVARRWRSGNVRSWIRRMNSQCRVSFETLQRRTGAVSRLTAPERGDLGLARDLSGWGELVDHARQHAR